MKNKVLLFTAILVIALFTIVAMRNARLSDSDVTAVNFDYAGDTIIAREQLSGEIGIDSVSILNFGDAMFGRQVGKTIASGTDPFIFFKAGFATTASKYDAVILNLEGPITESDVKCQKKPYSFRFATTTGQMLKENNIFAVNLANNHSFDCYEKGRGDTRKYLMDAGVGYFGGSTTTESYLETTINAQSVTFIGIDLTFDYKLHPEYETLIKSRKLADDLVIIHIHWGEEYRKLPTESQKSVARRLIDAGADAIIGHHPHIIEPMEFYNGKPIFYSLGNFIFDQITTEQNKGIGVGLRLAENASSTVTIYPYEIKRHSPLMMNKARSDEFCKTFTKEYVSSTTNPCIISY